MAGRLDQIENLLRPHVGSALLSRCPELIYGVNQILVRFLRTDATLSALLTQMDSLLFNTVYTLVVSGAFTGWLALLAGILAVIGVFGFAKEWKAYCSAPPAGQTAA